jgi:hypothetical protein
VLYVARQDDGERHHGGVFRMRESVFAPPEDLLIFVRPGAFNPAIFRSMYLDPLRGLWRHDPAAFLGLHALADHGARRAHRLRWSRWRRAHQARANRCHAARRARPGARRSYPRRGRPALRMARPGL